MNDNELNATVTLEPKKKAHIGNRPARLGIFESVAQAEQAVHRLLDAGIAKNDVGILCSDWRRKRFFPGLHKATLPGETYEAAIPVGGAIGAAVGGLALVATSIVTAGLPLLAAGAVLIAGGAIAGGFAGLMSTLGYDEETIEYCEEEVHAGKILVSVAVSFFDDDQFAKLEEAERILLESGATRVVAPVMCS